MSKVIGVGAKHDAGKDRWALMMGGMPRALQGIVKVLTFGAAKYDDHSWKQVPDAIERYTSAYFRHFNEIMLHGPGAVDEETGLLHIDHCNTNGLFLAELLRDSE